MCTYKNKRVAEIGFVGRFLRADASNKWTYHGV